MKYRFLALLICMSAFTVADAQEKHWEHDIYIEFGGAKSSATVKILMPFI